MGMPSPNGNARWSWPTLRAIVLDDVYRCHTYEEITELVSPEVAARLKPVESYGVWWFNRRRGEMRKVVEVGPGGEWVYRKRYKQVRKPRSEWVAVPIPDAGIPREWVDAAREALNFLVHRSSFSGCGPSPGEPHLSRAISLSDTHIIPYCFCFVYEIVL